MLFETLGQHFSLRVGPHPHARGGADSSPDARLSVVSARPLSGSQLFACLRSSGEPDAVLEIAREFSPRIQRYGPVCVVLDVSGLGRLLGDPHAIGAELARAGAVRGVNRVAVAPTQTAALLLTLAHPSLTVITTDVAEALADVPLACLEQLLADLSPPAHVVPIALALPVVPSFPSYRSAPVPLSSVTPVVPQSASLPSLAAFETLRRWGVTSVGELAALPPTDLAARLGQDGVRLQRLARGLDPRPLVPDPEVRRFIERMELEWPIDTLEPLSFVLARMLDPLSAALERADRGAAAIRLDLRLVDRAMHTRVLQLPAAMRDARVLRTLLLLDLESHPPAAAIDIVTLEIDPAPGRVIQYSLLERALPSPETLATLTARLGALVGEARCGSPMLLDSYRPDGFEMRRFDPPGGGSTASQGLAGGERVRPLLRRFRPPVAVRVAVDHRRPVRVAVDRRGMPGGDVTQAAGPWRTSGAWWDRVATHWNRDEWDVALSDGSICRLFHDRDQGVWFLEGLLD